MSSSTFPASSGIYRITCIPNKRIYIGSAVNLQSRRRVHLNSLRRNKHHSVNMQRAFNKYGEDAFVFDVLEFVLIPEMLIPREQYWLDTYLPFGPDGFNTNHVAGSNLGMIVSPETREKLRLANLGKKHSEETIRKRAEAGRGRIPSAETREKVRLLRTGTKRSDESRERSRLSHLGKTHLSETIEKMSAVRTGHVTSEETRTKISASNVAGNEWRMKTLIVTAPDGTVYTAHGIGRFCRDHSLNRSALAQVAKGNAPHHKGWTARYLEE